MTLAKTNYATSLSSGSSVADLVTVGEVVSIEAPEILNEAVEATNMGSGGWKEFVSSGLKEVSEFTATVNFVDADMTRLYNNMISGSQVNFYRVSFPDDGNSTWTFKALVTGIKPAGADAGSPEALTAEIKFRPSGSMVLA